MATEIQSGNLPHQFYHHHHHNHGFMQPTLVENENHLLDFKFPPNGISGFSNFYKKKNQKLN